MLIKARPLVLISSFIENTYPKICFTSSEILMENIPNMRLHSFWEASGTVAIPKVNTKVDNGTLFFFFLLHCCSERVSGTSCAAQNKQGSSSCLSAAYHSLQITSKT